MKSVVVDTNVILTFLTDRDPRLQRFAARLFERAAEAELRIVLPQVVLVEAVYLLRNLYRRSEAECAGLLDDLLAMPQVAVENEVPWAEVLEIWPKRLGGFSEAVLVAVARAGDHAIASFDRRLSRRLQGFSVTLLPLR